MKTSVLPLALLASIAGAASAQTNVTIYGVADVAVIRNDATAMEPVWGLISGQQSGSRLGIRGVEALGGGLSAIFTLENGFAIDTGALQQGDRLFGRQAFIGLSSDSFGTIKIGRQYALNHDALNVFDPFSTTLAGSTEGIAIGYLGGLPYFIAGNAANGRAFIAGNAANAVAVDIRVDNSIVLQSKNIGGFTGALQYAFGEQVGAFSNGSQVSASGTYVNGPIAAVATYLSARSIAGEVDQTSYLLGATYDLGVAKLHAGYQDNDIDSGATAVESHTYLLGTTIPVGLGNVLASWIRADDNNSSTKSDQLAVGYTYPLSKRTNMYTSASWQTTEAPGRADIKANVFMAGIRHLF